MDARAEAGRAAAAHADHLGRGHSHDDALDLLGWRSVASTTSEPAKVGVGIFHTFFSLAFAVVTWVGPAVAANTIAGERSGRTWEALQLTTLTPRSIARGKFLAAFTYISLYIVMLVPVGALPFLFGGVTASEVLIAFALLFLMALLAVAFGLAISAKFSSPAAAIIVTLLVALPVSLVAYGGGGVELVLCGARTVAWSPSGPPVAGCPRPTSVPTSACPISAFLLLLPAVLTAIPALAVLRGHRRQHGRAERRPLDAAAGLVS